MQVFLQGKLIGIESFAADAAAGLESLGGRCLFVSLVSEAIPRALLSHLGLAPELLGSSGGGQFLVVVTSEIMPAANQFLVDATRKLARLTGNRLRLVWASTENLGAWSDVRKRLDESMARWKGAGALEPEDLFEPFAEIRQEDEEFRGLWTRLPQSAAAVWDTASPILLRAEGEAFPLATHTAPSPSGEGPASAGDLAWRAQGRKAWGILRGDVDLFAERLRKAQSVEEHIQLSVFFRQFFAGEVQVLCTQGEFWQKVSVIYTGGGDFAVAGSWDALVPFAREMERLFHRTVEEYLKEFPGLEGKTISMAVALAPSAESGAAGVYQEAGRQLEVAKNSGRDSISVLGRVIDWKQLGEAADLRQSMSRLIEEFGCTAQYLGELGAFYRETDRVLPARSARRLMETQQRPWRLHRRLSRVLHSDERRKEFQKARGTVLAAFLTRGQAQLKLKSPGRVALEWARFLHEAD